MNRRRLLRDTAAATLAVLAPQANGGPPMPPEGDLIVLADLRHGAIGNLWLPLPGPRTTLIDLHGADVLRLWRAALLPALRTGTSLRGVSTWSDWLILEDCARSARLLVSTPVATDASWTWSIRRRLAWRNLYPCTAPAGVLTRVS